MRSRYENPLCERYVANDAGNFLPTENFPGGNFGSLLKSEGVGLNISPADRGHERTYI